MFKKMDSKNLRYILFLLDKTKHIQHDGKIFVSYNDAKNYANDCIKDNYSDKFIIGLFYMDLNKSELLITMVETFGFSNDVKKLSQLELFK